MKSERVFNMANYNIKDCKKCGFCKNWNDPTNSAISPRNPKVNLWTLDEKRKCVCTKMNFEMSATAFCGQYECKLEIR